MSTEKSRRKTFESSNYVDVSRRKDRNRSFHKSYSNRMSDWHHCEPVSEFSVGQWNSQGQRLYPTMSDSAVCGYSLPCDYSINSGYQIYPVCSANMYPTGLEYSRRLSKTIRNKNKYFHEIESIGINNSNFTSLPPSNIEDSSCNQKRRFSDPGLNNVDESNESSSSESRSDDCSVANESIVEQILELKTENKRLISELETSKSELKSLKTEFALISSKISCHEPFSLAQMVKEIRDAAQIRENVLLAKVEALVESCTNVKNMTNIVNEIDNMKKRLSALEYQLEHLKIHSKVESKVNGDALPSEIDTICKRKNEIEEKIIPCLENDVLKKDTPRISQTEVNTNNQEISSDYNGNSLSTVSCESLSSSLGPGSLHSAHVTLCGPVTDL